MTTLRERAEQLAARANEEDQRGEAWRPREVERHPNPLIGSVTGYNEVTNEYGKTQILNLTDLDGKAWSVWLTSMALKRAIEETHPGPGQMVFLRYEGQQTSKSTGRNFHSYKVVVENADDAAFQPEQPPAKSQDDIPF